MTRAVIVGHAFDGDPGFVGGALCERSIDTVTWWRESGAAPPDPASVDLVVSLGSVWHVGDRSLIEPIEREQRWLGDLHRHGVPTLGVCFGAQQLAAALGGRVERMARPEIGWSTVASHLPVLAGEWFEWHFDTTIPPEGATQLAANRFGSQAWSHGRAVAIQFHPEVNREIITRWLDTSSDGRDGPPGEIELTEAGTNRTQVLADTERLLPGAAERTGHLIEWFLGR